MGAGASVTTDPCLVLGRLAAGLAAGSGLPAALESVASGLGLRTVVLRSSAGTLLGVAGEVMQAVPMARSLSAADGIVELPVADVALLTVHGARPSLLPALRAVASVLALALVPSPGADLLLGDAEQDRDELADALHDGPIQSLVVARYAADAAVRGSSPEIARDAVQEALVEVRRTLWQVRPRGASGLVEALHQLSAQGAGFSVTGDVDLRGIAATVAYRLVQAVPGDVVLRRDGDHVVLELTGSLPSPERWARRALALGGELTASAGRIRLALPLTEPRDPS